MPPTFFGNNDIGAFLTKVTKRVERIERRLAGSALQSGSPIGSTSDFSRFVGSTTDPSAPHTSSPYTVPWDSVGDTAGSNIAVSGDTVTVLADGIYAATLVIGIETLVGLSASIADLTLSLYFVIGAGTYVTRGYSSQGVVSLSRTQFMPAGSTITHQIDTTSTSSVIQLSGLVVQGLQP